MLKVASGGKARASFTAAPIPANELLTGGRAISRSSKQNRTDWQTDCAWNRLTDRRTRADRANTWRAQRTHSTGERGMLALAPALRQFRFFFKKMSVWFCRFPAESATLDGRVNSSQRVSPASANTRSHALLFPIYVLPVASVYRLESQHWK